MGTLVSIVILLVGVLSMQRVPDTNCFKFTLPVRAEIYSESNSATNIVAEVQPNDVIYFCGERK